MAQRSAVIFDFDGTITQPYLDFDAIRAEIGIDSGPILEALQQFTDSERARALDILARYELDAADNATLQAGATETIDTLRARGHPVGILTRNARVSVEAVLRKFGITVDAIRTRDDGAIKPSPEPILSMCKEMDADPRQSWMVGDHLFDILTGINAGTRTVLAVGDPPPAHPNLEEAAERADFVIHALPELLDLVK
jgi:HAD superfamily hydrolase (TIGR01662 family)